ncbi:non-specific lipid-transfer protein-like protein At5g64080 [Brachypodium distachyon]|uniref:Bifunctional inhibitor/plant lipid transfer protein/seed storage helical domain-containing protein n=1 Tax=Brachypodium distachyon TaxID=15368 RepID=A0A2K2DUN1_BRADI|nr:non-specific lipid-transfer protein-like protein At5g64080 [Brachypodium distachyon]PNT77989.1 hypothetical protein BRADI_1g71680v3 [Brachypodium distachyon]|eukprot:XP_003558608.3 non-specific lipid-transfer protein-like protein At5g64080 [Brachypodium distachyon]
MTWWQSNNPSRHKTLPARIILTPPFHGPNHKFSDQHCSSLAVTRARMATEARSTTAMAWPSLLLIILSALATVITHVDGATGGVAAPAPAVDCTDALLSLAGCLSYVQEGSTVATPDASCCSGLKDVVKKEVACLCQAFQGSQDYGVTLNMTKALQLPDACKVKTPPFSKCHLSVPGVTGGSPAPAPSSGAPFFGESPSSSTPSAASPAGTGSDATARAPSPSSSAPATFQSSAEVFLAAATVAATLLMP